jgi:hypothetical protein
MPEKYSFKDYDKYFSLKLCTGLWLAVFYFMHPYLLLLSGLQVKNRDAAALKNMIYPDNFSMVIAILATIPALFFIYAWARRSPGGSALVKFIWRNGSMVLTLAALLNIATVFMPLLLGSGHRIQIVGWVQVGISSVIIIYVQFSRRVRDTFADFPEEKTTDQV